MVTNRKTKILAFCIIFASFAFVSIQGKLYLQMLQTSLFQFYNVWGDEMPPSFNHIASRCFIINIFKPDLSYCNIIQYMSMNSTIHKTVPTIENLPSLSPSIITSILTKSYDLYYKLWEDLLEKQVDPQLIFEYLFPIYSLKLAGDNILLYRVGIFNFYQDSNSHANYEDNYQDFPDPSYYWLYYNTPKPVNPSVIPGTFYFQHILWNHQHPQNCKNQKFLLVTDISYGSGIGNTMHNLATMLHFALYHKRIMVYANNQKEWIDSEWCDVNSFDCYFEPLTNCSYPVEELTNKPNNKKYDSVQIKFYSQFILYPNTTYWVISFSNLLNFGYYNTIPPQFQYFYDTFFIPERDRYIHWRIQAVTFIARMNKRTLNWIEDYEKSNCPTCKTSYDISMHIRHADKVLEMTIVPDEYYTYPIRFLASYLKRPLNIFINGDDESSVQYMKNHISYSISSFDSDIRKNEDVFKVLTYKHVTLKVLASFKHQLYGKHTIGTFASNWVRLIYELKQTVGLHSNGFFLEVGENTCISYTHCKLLHTSIKGN